MYYGISVGFSELYDIVVSNMQDKGHVFRIRCISQILFYNSSSGSRFSFSELQVRYKSWLLPSRCLELATLYCPPDIWLTLLWSSELCCCDISLSPVDAEVLFVEGGAQWVQFQISAIHITQVTWSFHLLQMGFFQWILDLGTYCRP